MSRYVISDHHFGHNNIIKYCNRPFGSVGEMNSTLLDKHFEAVKSDDVLIHLGDVAMDMQSGEETIEYFQRLDGDLLLRGNHDVGLSPEEAPFPVLEASILEAGGYCFYCTHRPEDIPEAWNGWVIHGHMHNNNPDEFPFFAGDEKRICVSVELVNYYPVAVEHLVALIEEVPRGSRLRDIEAAKSFLSD